MDDEDEGLKDFANQPEDEEEKFLNFVDQNDSSQTSPAKDNLFKDADYQEENKTLNRVK